LLLMIQPHVNQGRLFNLLAEIPINRDNSLQFILPTL